MKRKRRREIKKGPPVQIATPVERRERIAVLSGWPGEHSRYLTVIGIALIALCTVIIYGQTVPVPPIDYEDPFYLVHSPYVHVSAAFAGMRSVWNEPYFANFHPVTTTTWLFDRALADKSKPFDGIPFRVANLLYAAAGASVLIALYRRLGIPRILAVLGALVWAVHPIHTEVVAWLSARKDLVSLLFIVLSFLSWIWARAAATPNQWRLRHALTIVLVLLAVLSKPIAAIIPALFVAYEFCSASHAGIWRWRWAQRYRYPLLTRTVALTVIFVVVGALSTVVFGRLLSIEPMHGGWLILVPLGLLLGILAVAPPVQELAAFREGTATGIRVIAPPFVVISFVFGAGSAWTFWAQRQVGAIKGGLTWLPTLNLTFDAMLAYAGKTLVPASMSAFYSWNEYPYVSVKGLIGAALIGAAVWTAIGWAGSEDRNRRLIALGIFWYLIALLPVSNLVPTSTKMADRYLFVPSVGAVLALLAIAAQWGSTSRRRQITLCAAFVPIIGIYTAWSYNHTKVWCGKTVFWNGKPQPDLSLWTDAVETDPDNTHALTSLALAYLHLSPPDADKALEHLNRALQISQESQEKIAGGKQLVLTPLYEALGDGYFARAAQISADTVGSKAWPQKKEAYLESVKYYELASLAPSGFASSDARILSRLAEACEGLAAIYAQELTNTAPELRASLIRQRDDLRGKSEQSMRRAREVLTAGNVSPIDTNFRMVALDQGNIIFNREVGASSKEEKAAYYHQALMHYQEAGTLLPDDPRPFLYQGLCYERLTDIAQSPVEKAQQFALAEAALRKAITLSVDSPDYSRALPYQALASLYVHMNDYRSALDALKSARQADPASSDSAHLESEIESIEHFLSAREPAH
jgi:tetratricopeptide (TPR) repeat protein